MNDLEETRYPFLNFIDFFGGGYIFDIQSLHLAFALATIVYITHFSFKENKNSRISLLILFFILSPYNNPAFTYSGIALNEYIGIICIVVYSLFDHGKLNPANKFMFWCYMVFLIILTQTLIILLLSDDLINNHTLLSRMIVFGKPFLTLTLGNILINEFCNLNKKILPIVKLMIIATSSTYLIQITSTYIFGIASYGSYVSATVNHQLSTILSFGGTSIERGHFSKLFNPLFPYATLLLMQNSKIVFLLFIIVLLINFSASGYAYSLIMTMTLAYFFRSKIFTLKNTILISAMLIIFFYAFHNEVQNLVNKIITLSNLNNEDGGRGIKILWLYLDNYPFGIGFGGSSFRSLEGFPEINSGYIALLTQLSITGLLIFIAFFSYILSLTKNTLKNKSYAKNTTKTLLIGVIAMPFIFIIDPLWFSPINWLALFLLFGYKKTRLDM